jgi:hypothetical protein
MQENERRDKEEGRKIQRLRHVELKFIYNNRKPQSKEKNTNVVTTKGLKPNKIF